MPLAIINFWLDVTLLLTILFIGWVSAMMQVVFPAPTSADGWSLWGLSFDQWRDAQFGALCFFSLLALVHVMLHWNWICGVITTRVVRTKNRPDDGIQTIYGVGTMIVVLNLIVGAVIAAMLTVQKP